MPLADIQNLLTRVYGIETPLDVRDFVISENCPIFEEGEGALRRRMAEKLLLVQEENNLDVALYLDASVVERLERIDPQRYLGRRNLEDFCTVLEGISHFLYIVYNASRDRSITLLEMELQAEVDKYVGARLLLDHQGSTQRRRYLLQNLFENFALLEGLDQAEQQRYVNANRFAVQYCYQLDRRYSVADAHYLGELRSFYRANQPRKLSRINAAQFA